MTLKREFGVGENAYPAFEGVYAFDLGHCQGKLGQSSRGPTHLWPFVIVQELSDHQQGQPKRLKFETYAGSMYQYMTVLLFFFSGQCIL